MKRQRATLFNLRPPFEANREFIASRLFGVTAGFNLDFAATSSLYQDNLAATPLTLPDTAIGLAADRSRARSPVTAAAGAQASAGLRPKWGRAPRLRRNLLIYSNDFTNAVWGKTRSTVTPAAAVAPDGTLTASKLVETATTGAHYIGQSGAVHNETRTFAVWLKAAERSWAVIQVGSNLAYGIAYVNLLTGEISGATGGYTVTCTLVAGGSGWYKCVISGASNSSTVAAIGAIYASTGSGVLSYTGDGTSGIYMWRAQVEPGAVDTAHQDAPSAFDMTEVGLPSFGYARWGLDDDVLTVTTPEAQTGDVMIFGRKGSWLQEGVAYGSGAAVAIGPTTMTGLPAGLLAAVQGAASDASGGIVGVLAIGRTLSAAERTLALDYHKARGALGWLTAGAELITNGAFNTDLTGWTAYNSAVLTLSSQRMQVANGAAGRAGGAQSFTTVIGQSYIFSVDVTNGSHPAFIYFGTAMGSGGVFAMSNITGHADAVFIATATTTWITLMPSSTGVGNTTLFDNVSVKPLTVAA